GFRFDPSVTFIEDLLFSAILGGSVLFYLWNLMLRLERVGKVTVMAFSIPIISSIEDQLTGEIELNRDSYLGMTTMLLGILLSRKDEMVFKPKLRTHVVKT
ncbi:MAG: DMT family transporter, partial [Metallosphaera sp.]